MRRFLLFLIWILVGNLHAQLLNPSFEDWEVIHIGQPYENPIGWKTNNETNKFGLASTPVDKGENKNGFHARVSSTAHGIDATFSGMLSQKIAISNLVLIEFDSQCDSLFQTGRCVVSILDESGNHTLFVDTISTQADEFSQTILPIDKSWALNNDSIILQFTAVGGFDQWDEMEDGYSIYLIDNVSAEYISSSELALPEVEMEIYPNPTSGIIHLKTNRSHDPEMVEIVSITGQSIIKMDFVSVLDVEWVPDGIYMLKLISRRSSESNLLIIQH